MIYVNFSWVICEVISLNYNNKLTIEQATVYVSDRLAYS